MADAQLHPVLQRVALEAREIMFGSAIREVDSAPDSLTFLRHHVATNVPLIIRGGAAHWDAYKKWNVDYLKSIMGNKSVHVEVTPDGYADSELEGKFLLPLETEEPFSDFIDRLSAAGVARQGGGEVDWGTEGIPYCQFQNSSLDIDFPELAKDVEVPEFAISAFGSPPEVRNLWLGPDEAITTMHRDPYENIYCVIRGQKLFTLIPPTDFGVSVNFSHELEAMRHTRNAQGDWALAPENYKLRWISRALDEQKFTEGVLGTDSGVFHPFLVRLGPGDMLYLPSHWFHGVRQRGGDDLYTLAVNMWWDAQFDARYLLAEALADELRPQA